MFFMIIDCGRMSPKANRPCHYCCVMVSHASDFFARFSGEEQNLSLVKQAFEVKGIRLQKLICRPKIVTILCFSHTNGPGRSKSLM